MVLREDIRMDTRLSAILFLLRMDLVTMCSVGRPGDAEDLQFGI